MSFNIKEANPFREEIVLSLYKRTTLYIWQVLKNSSWRALQPLIMTYLGLYRSRMLMMAVFLSICI